MAEVIRSVSESYARQFRKLKTESLKEQAIACQRDLVRLVGFILDGEGQSSEARLIGTRRRVRPIQRHRGKKPRRFEATFAPDGRIVWALEGNNLFLVYIGTHRVLDME